MSRRELRMVTGNRHKFLEARLILAEFQVDLLQVDAKRLEIQAEDVEEVARFSAEDAARRLGGPLIVEDAGLFIHHLGGFPGPYSSYVLRTIGLEGVLRLMKGASDRRAHFKSAIAFCEAPGRTPRVFTGVVEGVISKERRGEKGFGYDPIFIPLEGDGRTFAEMETEEKGRLSHRGRALRKFAEWFTRMYENI
ncbi:XTP/dITP diphosphatase [Candidatus Bathyarchaeota archaeon]|nr:MAG: XTP/dITP diphosphatase [Candidatus Bathyarchaeota archaeon]